jgi:hypothetical protein
MKNKLMAVVGSVALFVSAGSVLAQSDSANHYYNGENKFGGIVDLQGTVKIGGTTLTATAALLNQAATMVDGSANIATVSYNTAATSMVLSASYNTYLVNVSGLANAGSNVLSLTGVYPIGCEWTFVGKGQTNNFYIADSAGAVDVGAGVICGSNDTVRLKAIATNLLVRVGGVSDN